MGPQFVVVCKVSIQTSILPYLMQMLLILQMIVEKGGKVDVLDFASRLHTWMTQGFKELGDIGKLYSQCVTISRRIYMSDRWNGDRSNHKESADSSKFPEGS